MKHIDLLISTESNLIIKDIESRQEMSTLSVFIIIFLQHMKKLVLVVSLCACLLVVTWCGQRNNTTDTTNDNPQPPVQAEPVAENPAAENGDLVSIYYIGRSQEAGLFDTNVEEVAQEEGLYNAERPYEPLEFVLGAWTMIPGMETGVVGMNVGETKTITIQAGEAYGEYREELVQELPKENFATAGIDPVVNETYNFGIAQGKVLEINDETIKMDFNHQLAWQVLTFEVTVEKITKASQLNNE